MSRLLFRKAQSAGFTLVQTMVAMGIMATLLAAVYTSFTALIGSMKASENYSVGQLMAVDYLTLDLRRCQGYTFTTALGTTWSGASPAPTSALTLPLTLQLPQYYAADGKTPNVPQRALVSSVKNQHGKKDFKVFSARYYTYYGTLGTTAQVVYSLDNKGVLTRTETPPGKAALPPRAVGSNIQSVTFGPSAAAIVADPVITTTIAFSRPRGWKAASPPPSLSGTTFMREYYYSDY